LDFVAFGVFLLKINIFFQLAFTKDYQRHFNVSDAAPKIKTLQPRKDIPGSFSINLLQESFLSLGKS
jgi:hypothetical protein